MDNTTLAESLRRLAANHRWTWVPSSERLLARLPGARPGLHPAEAVASLSRADLDGIAADIGLVADIAAEVADLERVTTETSDPEIAYYSPEFGITELFPQYAGGLGILAGDHLKAASDLGVPLVGVGLLYRQGYFTQAVADGRQTESYPTVDPQQAGARDTGHVVTVPLPGREVLVRVWRIDVGRVPLLLLDTDVEGNSEADRAISDRLYGGGREHRLDQEMVLGVGGARAIEAMGWTIAVHHLNEGHAGFVVLELIDRVIESGDLAGAVETVRPGLVFTTHTPVPAGIDRFHRDLALPYLEEWARRWGLPAERLWELGEDPEDTFHFNVAALTLRLCHSANGVSRLHGAVSRSLFAGVGCGDSIGSVTNGVHARTWVAAETQEVFDRVLGREWSEGDAEAWYRVGTIDDGLLTAMRRRARRRLADLVASTGANLHPEALVIGFARRFAPYKRATLMLRERDRLLSLLGDSSGPVHFVFSGKAHPLDEMGKELLAEIVAFGATQPGLTFLPDYDMGVAKTLVQGCDIWLNNPVRPREASGTSGQKAALNGGLNCSILDGWWAEMFDGRNGWAIPTSDHSDPEARDTEEAAALLDVLCGIREEFFGNRVDFNERVRHAWRTLGPSVTAARMVAAYAGEVYRPALRRARANA